MASKGAEEKQMVINKIKEVFPEAFEYDKVIRIPINGVQIKVALTTAKDNVEIGGDNAIPEAKVTNIAEGAGPVFGAAAPSQEELDAVNNLMAQLGL